MNNLRIALYGSSRGCRSLQVAAHSVSSAVPRASNATANRWKTSREIESRCSSKGI